MSLKALGIGLAVDNARAIQFPELRFACTVVTHVNAPLFKLGGDIFPQAARLPN